MRLSLALLALPLALAGCVSPQQACLSGVDRDARTVEALIRQTQGNLARGYALQEDQVIRQVPDFCHYTDDDGRTRTTFCDRTEVRNVSRPVAIDPAAERAKLDGLLEQRATLASSRPNRLAACAALPDSPY